MSVTSSLTPSVPFSIKTSIKTSKIGSRFMWSQKNRILKMFVISHLSYCQHQVCGNGRMALSGTTRSGGKPQATRSPTTVRETCPRTGSSRWSSSEMATGARRRMTGRRCLHSASIRYDNE